LAGETWGLQSCVPTCGSEGRTEMAWMADPPVASMGSTRMTVLDAMSSGSLE
jgi:hypothetical protein